MPNRINEPLYLYAERLVGKHTQRGKAKLETLELVIVAGREYETQPDAPMSPLEWETTHRIDLQYSTEVDAIGNLFLQPFDATGALMDVKPNYIGKPIHVVDWGNQHLGTIHNLQPTAALVFILAQYSDGHVSKLGEITQGEIDGPTYRKLQREMTETLLNPDWEEILKPEPQGFQPLDNQNQDQILF